MKQQSVFGPVSWVIEPTIWLAITVLIIVLFIAELDATNITITHSSVPDTESVRIDESAENFSARDFDHRV